VIRTRRRLLGMLTAILAATLTSLLFAGSALADTATPEEPVSPNATAIDDIYLVILGATITIFVLVGGFLLYSSIRFRERPGDPDPPQTHGSTKLELGWTIVPILIVLFGLILGYSAPLCALVGARSQGPSLIAAQLVSTTRSGLSRLTKLASASPKAWESCSTSHLASTASVSRPARTFSTNCC